MQFRTPNASPQGSRQTTQHPQFQPSRGSSLFDGLKQAPSATMAPERQISRDLALFNSPAHQLPPGTEFNWPTHIPQASQMMSGFQSTTATEEEFLRAAAEVAASASQSQSFIPATTAISPEPTEFASQAAFPHPWGFLGKTYPDQLPASGAEQPYNLVRKDTFLWNASSGPTPWRDPFDDQASSYSSSISRPSSPTLSSYRGTPSLSDLDQYTSEELSNQMETDIPLFNPIHRDETVQPKKLQSAIATALRETTLRSPPHQLNFPAGSSTSPRRASFFGDKDISASPSTSPTRASFEHHVPRSTPNYALHYSNAPTGSGVSAERKDSFLSKLAIPIEGESSDMGDATAGPATAKAGSTHVLDQLLKEARNMSTDSSSHAENRDQLSGFTRPPMQPYMSNPTFPHMQHEHMPKRQRSHSDAEVPLLYQAQQNAMQQHWEQNGRVPPFSDMATGAFASPGASPASIIDQSASQRELIEPYFNQQDSMVGPNRHSNASDSGLDHGNWPYGDALSRSSSAFEPNDRPNYALGQMDENALLYPATSGEQAFYSQSMDAPRYLSNQQSLLGNIGLLSTLPEPNYNFTDSRIPDSNFFSYPQDAFGNPIYNVNAHGSSSGCPSPTYSNSSYDPRRYNSSNFDENDLLSNPIHKESQTTRATKQAAAARRKPGVEAKYVCEYCGESFTRNYNLRGHLRAHNGVKPFGCPEPGCGKAFARAHDLKRHSALHTTISKYKCLSCGKAFKRLDALQRHHRSETGQQCVAKICEAGEFDPKVNGLVRVTPIHQGVTL